jgi:alpha-N-arabinofuranosidase
MELIASNEINNEESSDELNFQIKADKDVYSFYYSLSNGNDESIKWNLLKDNVDAKYLSVKIPRDFTGCIFALYATALGNVSNNDAYFNYFEYVGNDEIY